MISEERERGREVMGIHFEEGGAGYRSEREGSKRTRGIESKK